MSCQGSCRTLAQVPLCGSGGLSALSFSRRALKRYSYGVYLQEKYSVPSPFPLNCPVSMQFFKSGLPTSSSAWAAIKTKQNKIKQNKTKKNPPQTGQLKQQIYSGLASPESRCWLIWPWWELSFWFIDGWLLTTSSHSLHLPTKPQIPSHRPCLHDLTWS